MIRKVAAAFLALLLILPPSSFAKEQVNSVQAIQSNGRTFCTAWSINEAEGLWATAAHCAAFAVTEEAGEVTILGELAHVVYIGYPSVDIAVMQADIHVKAIKLSTKAPEVGDYVEIVGYAYGITRMTTKGTLAARRIPIIHPSTGYYITSDILNVVVAGGNSGSPVLNRGGEAIGVLWGGFTESAHSLGVSYEGTLRALLPFASK
jgi:S1-C subfamily serine protease